METCCHSFIHSAPVCFHILIGVLIIWEMIWKIIAMWKSARNNQLTWFICIAVLNTIGILPIVYLMMHRKK